MYHLWIDLSIHLMQLSFLHTHSNGNQPLVLSEGLAASSAICSHTCLSNKLLSLQTNQTSESTSPLPNLHLDSIL